MPSVAPVPLRHAPVSPRWVFPAVPDPAVASYLAAELNLPPIAIDLLIRRGYSTSAAAKEFLRPARSQVHGHSGLADIEVAVERVVAGIRKGEVILVHGDYDVDGICGTALLLRSLRMMGGRAVPFVPDRRLHGYDLTDAGLDAAGAAGASLILTADCGIVAHDAVVRAATRGIDVVITDHHTPGPTLPAAVAVLNPNRPDCEYPNKGLVGAAVAFKLACAVADAIGFPEERVHAFLDLVAIATIADLAPLTGENRALVRWGLSILSRTPNPGLRALLRSAGIDAANGVTAGQVGFILAPRLNAVGRVADPMVAVELLVSDDPERAARLAEILEVENRRRRELDQETLADVLEILDRDYDPDRDWGVVLASDRWHPGVIGIVASRVVERIHRPTVLIALEGEEGKGSARSIRGFHLHEAFVDCSRHLTRFGGHRAAAGCSLDRESVQPFREAFNEVARARLTAAELAPELYIDAELPLDRANFGTLRLIRHFAPFGVGNPTPLFAARRVQVHGRPKVVGKGHLKLVLRDGDTRLPGIGFGLAQQFGGTLQDGDLIDVAFRLEENVWRGMDSRIRHSIQARIADIRPST